MILPNSNGFLKLCALSSQVFRKDLISAMKIPDSHHINPDSYYLFADTWKEEWEKGVQVPANPDNIPQPSLRYLYACIFDLGNGCFNVYVCTAWRLITHL